MSHYILVPDISFISFSFAFAFAKLIELVNKWKTLLLSSWISQSKSHLAANSSYCWCIQCQPKRSCSPLCTIICVLSLLPLHFFDLLSSRRNLVSLIDLNGSSCALGYLLSQVNTYSNIVSGTKELTYNLPSFFILCLMSR